MSNEEQDSYPKKNGLTKAEVDEYWRKKKRRYERNKYGDRTPSFSGSDNGSSESDWNVIFCPVRGECFPPERWVPLPEHIRGEIGVNQPTTSSAYDDQELSEDEYEEPPPKLYPDVTLSSRKLYPDDSEDPPAKKVRMTRDDVDDSQGSREGSAQGKQSPPLAQGSSPLGDQEESRGA